MTKPRAHQNAQPQPRRLDAAWLVTIAVGIVLAGVVATLVARNQAAGPAPKRAPAAKSDRTASPALIRAADAVGFQPTTEPGVGLIEDKPASAANAPLSTHLLTRGAAAPDFTLKTPQGQPVSLSDYRGKAVLLELFATWCPHCQAEAPHLRALDQLLGSSRYAFVSVNADSEDAASVFAFHRYFGLQYPALVDRSGSPLGSFSSPGGLGNVAAEYGLQAYPTFYVIDPTGRVYWAGDGEQPDAFLRDQLEAAAGG